MNCQTHPGGPTSKHVLHKKETSKLCNPLVPSVYDIWPNLIWEAPSLSNNPTKSQTAFLYKVNTTVSSYYELFLYEMFQKHTVMLEEQEGEKTFFYQLSRLATKLQ